MKKLFRMLLVLAFWTVALSCVSLRAYAANTVTIEFGQDSNISSSGSVTNGRYARVENGSVKGFERIENNEVPSGAIGVLSDGTVVINNCSYTYTCTNSVLPAVYGINVIAADDVNIIIKGQCSIGIAADPRAYQSTAFSALRLEASSDSIPPEFVIKAGDSSAKLTLSSYPATGKTTGSYQGIYCAGSLSIGCSTNIYAGTASGVSYGTPASCKGIFTEQTLVISSGTVNVYANGAKANGSCIGAEANTALLITHGTLAVNCEGALGAYAVCRGVSTDHLTLTGWEKRENGERENAGGFLSCTIRPISCGTAVNTCALNVRSSFVYQGGAVKLDLRSYPGIDTENAATAYTTVSAALTDTMCSPYRIEGGGTKIENSALANQAYRLLTIEGIGLPTMKNEMLIQYTYDETSAGSRLESFLNTCVSSDNGADKTVSVSEWTVIWYTDSACTAAASTANGAARSGGAPSYAGDYWVKLTYNGSLFTSGWTNTIRVAIRAFCPTSNDIEFVGAADACFDKFYDGLSTLPETGIRVFIRTLPSQPEITGYGSFRYANGSAAGTKKTVCFQIANAVQSAGPGGSILLSPDQSFPLDRTGTVAYAWVNGTPIINEYFYKYESGTPTVLPGVRLEDFDRGLQFTRGKNGAPGTLTLKNFSFSKGSGGSSLPDISAVYVADGTTIKLEGTSTVQGSATAGSQDSCGIYSTGALTILSENGGVLCANAGDAGNNSFGIRATALTVDGASVYASGGESDDGMSCGVRLVGTNPALTVTRSGFLSAKAVYGWIGSYGIHMRGGSVTVSSGKIYAQGNTSNGNAMFFDTAAPTVTLPAGYGAFGGNTSAEDSSALSVIRENKSYYYGLGVYQPAHYLWLDTAPIYYDTYLNGTQLNSRNCIDFFGDLSVRYTPADASKCAELMLTDSQGHFGTSNSGTASRNLASVYSAEELKITLIGENSIAGPNSSGASSSYGIWSDSVLTIGGSGSLTVTGGSPIYKDASCRSYGIHAQELQIMNDARVTAKGGACTGSSLNVSIGVYCEKCLSLSGHALLDAAGDSDTNGGIGIMKRVRGLSCGEDFNAGTSGILAVDVSDPASPKMISQGSLKSQSRSHLILASADIPTLDKSTILWSSPDMDTDVNVTLIAAQYVNGQMTAVKTAVANLNDGVRAQNFEFPEIAGAGYKLFIVSEDGILPLTDVWSGS